MSRPKSHIYGDLAVAALHKVFVAKGWACNDITKDYGEDLLVRIFDDGNTSPYQFFVQSKSSGSGNYALVDGGLKVSVQVNRSSLKQWVELESVVLITFYDVEQDKIYWTTAKEHSHLTERGNGKTVRLHISKDQLLDENALINIRVLVQVEYDRLENMREGACLLAEILKEDWGVDIEFEEDGAFSVPVGKFVPHKSGGVTVHFFGDVRKLILTFLENKGIVDDDINTRGAEEIKKLIFEGIMGDVNYSKDEAEES